MSDHKLFRFTASLLLSASLVSPAVVATPAFAQDSNKAKSSSSSTNAQVKEYEWELTKVGTFSGSKDDVEFGNNTYGVAYAKKGDGYQLIGETGEALLEGQELSNIVYLGNDNYVVTIGTDADAVTGLVDADGTELVPCDATTSSYLASDAFTGSKIADNPRAARYLQFYYVTDDSGNEGYAKIYDLQKKAFVKGIKIDISEDYKLMDMGDSFAMFQDKVCTIYSAAGKELWSQEGESYEFELGCRCVIWRLDDKYQVIDASGKARYVSDLRITSMDGNLPSWYGGDYVCESDGGTYRVIDFDGKAVLKDSYETVPYFTNGLFSVEKDDKYYALLPDGEQVAELKYGTVKPILPGYNTVTLVDGDSAIFKGDDIIAQGEGTANNLVATNDGEYLVLNDESFMAAVEDETELDIGLVSGRSGSSMTYGLYDLFTGKQLLKDEYDVIGYGGNRIFAHKGKSWTVYETTLSEV